MTSAAHALPLPSLAQLANDYDIDGTWLSQELVDLAAEHADPERCQRDVIDFLVRGGRLATELRSMRYDPIALELLVKLSAHSRFGMELAALRTRVFWDVVQEREFRQVWGRSLLREGLQRQLRMVEDYQHQINALVRYRNQHLLRLILGDIQDTIGFEGVTSELSDLTDVLVDAAMDLAQSKLKQRYGKPQCSMSVLGMGKLGGRELNYSSDIDLIFVYQERGETVGGEKTIDHHDYFRRLGAEMIAVLDKHHPVGRLFRVDMRLRPHGASGELVLSLKETVDYYFGVGRAWERQAMLKARPIAGDLELGQQLLEDLRPWVFPKDLAVDQLDDARVMRRRIEERATEANVKTGAGGIRDIEFLVQFFQLGYGGSNPNLRMRATLPALRALADSGLIANQDAVQLESDYIWLRMVEHRLQMYEARQLHEVPQDRDERLALALRSGFEGDQALDHFDQRLADVQRRVRSFAKRYYLDVSSDEDRFLALIGSQEVDPDFAERLLSPYGFADPMAAARRLRSMADEPFFILRRDRTERELIRLLPELLARLTDAPNIDEALSNIQRIVDAVGGRSAFFMTLREQPELLNTVVNLAGWASFAVTELTRFPGLPDDLGPCLADGLLSDESRVSDQAAVLAAGLADPIPSLGYFKARETVSAAVADLADADPWRVWQHLSLVARAVLGQILHQSIVERAEAWGAPVRADGSPCRFAILGLGKLGGGELSYASDMDIIYVCDAGGRCTKTDHDGDAFWTRVAKHLAQQSQGGRLYEIDPRLRPWGDQGQLVVSLDTLRNYWAQPRDLWERMAMLRVAPVAGDSSLAAEACDNIRRAALMAPMPDDAVHQVRHMRSRLEESVHGRDHLKRGWGGYTDIEFATFYCCMGMDADLLPAGASVAELLDSLQRIGRIPKDAAMASSASLTFLRQTEARMRLMEGRAISSLPTDGHARHRFARCAGFKDIADMDLRLHLAREQARTWYDHLVV